MSPQEPVEHRLATLSAIPELAPSPDWTIELEAISRECGPGSRPTVGREISGGSVEAAITYYQPLLAAAGWKLSQTPLTNGVPGARFSKTIGERPLEVVIAPGHNAFSLRATDTGPCE